MLKIFIRFKNSLLIISNNSILNNYFTMGLLPTLILLRYNQINMYVLKK